MIPVRILGTSSLLPGRRVSTAEVARQVGRDPEEVERKSGIQFRHWIGRDELRSCAHYAATALREALAVAGLPAQALRRIIYVSSLVGDKVCPATANQVAAELGLSGSCDAFDLNNACLGFLSAFDVAARSVATGLGPVGIAVVDLPYAHGLSAPVDPRPYLVFGDAIAAAVLGAAPAGPGGGGLLASHLSNDGSQASAVVAKSPYATGQLERLTFSATHAGIGKQALEGMLYAVRELLDSTNTRLTDIEWVLPHQPNGSMLRTIMAELELDPRRVVPVVQDIGSVGSVSIPFSLDRLLRTRPVRSGDRILMLGIGAGVSRGALLYQVGDAAC